MELQDATEGPHKKPTGKKLYLLYSKELKKLKAFIGKFLESGWIIPSLSPYGVLILFAKQKDGGLHICIDYRQLNSNIVLDSFPLLLIGDLLQLLNGVCVFSKLDIWGGYDQLPIQTDD